MNNIPRAILEGHLRFALKRVSGRLLNAGCGDQTYEQMYLPYIQSQIRYDWPKTIHDRRMIDVYGDVSRLPFHNESFDTVWCTEVLEHVPDPAAVLAEFERVTKPGGCLVLSTPFLYQIHESPFDFYRYTFFGLKHLLTDRGFIIDHCFARGGILGVVIFFVRKLLHRILSKLLGIRIAKKVPLMLLDRLYLFLAGKRARFMNGETTSYTLGYTVIASKPA